MTVRPATAADLDAIVAMGLRFRAQTAYQRTLPENADQLRTLAERLLTTDDSRVFVAEDGGVLVGMIGALVFAHPMSAERLASEVFWWSESPGVGMRLFYAMHRWAKAQGAVALQMIAPTEQVERIYQRLGFDRVETLYQRRIA